MSDLARLTIRGNVPPGYLPTWWQAASDMPWHPASMYMASSKPFSPTDWLDGAPTALTSLDSWA